VARDDRNVATTVDVAMTASSLTMAWSSALSLSTIAAGVLTGRDDHLPSRRIEARHARFGKRGSARSSGAALGGRDSQRAHLAALDQRQRTEQVGETSPRRVGRDVLQAGALPL